MSGHKWNLRIDIESDDGELRSSTAIEMTSAHAIQPDTMSVSEAIAVDMQCMLRALIESGKLISPAPLEDCAKAFSEW